MKRRGRVLLAKRLLVFLMSLAMVLDVAVSTLIDVHAAEITVSEVETEVPEETEELAETKEPGETEQLPEQTVSENAVRYDVYQDIPESENTVRYDVYQDTCETWERSDNRMNVSFGKGGGVQHAGEACTYIKIDSVQETRYDWIHILRNTQVSGLNTENSCLEFYINPYMYVANAQVGLVCAVGEEKYSIRLPLDNYVPEENYVMGTAYQLVTIPFSDFAAGGVCYNDATGEVKNAEEFVWDSILGVIFGAQIEAGVAANWCYLDEIVLMASEEGEDSGEEEKPEEGEILEHIHDFYLDGWVSAWTEASGIPGYEVSQVNDEAAKFNAEAKEGEVALRMKLQNIGEGGYQWLKALKNPITDIDKEHTALQFWISPMMKVDDMQVGLVCESAGTYPTVRILLNDYLNESDYDTNGWKWKLITIPFTEFEEKGAYYDGNEQLMDAADFNWGRIAGVTFGGDTTAFPVDNQLSVCRLDSIAFTKWNMEEQLPEEGRTHIKDFFLDSFEECSAWFTSSSGQNVSNPVDEAAAFGAAAAQGEKALRMKLTNDGSGRYEWAKILTNPLTGIDKNQAALQFYISPMTELSDMQAGLVCEASGEYPTLRVSLKDYLVQEDYDVNGWKWKQIVIPFTDLKEKGICYDANENVIDTANFNWGRIAGVTIGAKTDNLKQEEQTSVWRLDDIALVEYKEDGEEEEKAEDPATVVYDAEVLGERYQQVTGWGVYPSNQEGANFDTKTAVHEALFRDMGITCFRMELRGSCVNEDGTEFTTVMDNLISKLRIATQDYGISKYSLHIWSPLGYMKTNGSYGSGKNPDGSVARLLPEYEEEFCEWVVKCLDKITGEGIPAPYAFSIQNEPSTSTEYQSCNYEKEQYIRVVKQMRKTLDTNGYEDIILMGPESDEYKNAVTWLGEGFTELEKDAEFYDALGIIASHSYLGKSATDEKFIDFMNNAAKYPDKEIWMTEFCTAAQIIRPLEIDRAIESARILASDMAWAGNNTWIWWLGWDPRYSVKNEYQEVLLEGDGRESVYKGSMYTILATLFQHVPVGSRVQRMSVTDPTVVNEAALQSDLVAFDTEEGTVCMIINQSETAKEYHISGLEGKSAAVYTASEVNHFMEERSCLNIREGRAEGVFLPKRSVTILVTEQDDVAGPKILLEENGDLFDEGNQYASRESEIILNGFVDERAVVTINEIEVSLGTDYGFNHVITLTEGLNIVTIRAVDTVGNVSEKQLKIVYDPDYFALVLDKTADRVNNQDYIVAGRVNVEAKVAVNGEEAELKPDLTFEKQITLEQGKNTIIVVADDGSQQKAVTVNVDCDSVFPVIDLDNQNETVNDFEYVIAGRVSEVVENLTVGEYEAAVGTNHEFIRKISLAKGENQIIVQATDQFGNVGMAELNITYEETDNSPKLPDAEKPLTYAVKTENEVVIDGDVTEGDWIIKNKSAKVFSGTPNNIVNFGAMWDAEYLYIGAVVKDNILCFGDAHEPCRQYEHDCMEVFIHPSNTKEGAFSAEKGDMQLFVGWDKDKQHPFDNGKGILTGWKDLEDGYSVEMAIPWSIIRIDKVEAGVEIGFDVVNDDSDIYGSRQHIEGWAGTSDNWQTTKDYGTLLLTQDDESNPDEGDVGNNQDGGDDGNHSDNGDGRRNDGSC